MHQAGKQFVWFGTDGHVECTRDIELYNGWVGHVYGVDLVWKSEKIKVKKMAKSQKIGLQMTKSRLKGKEHCKIALESSPGK